MNSRNTHLMLYPPLSPEDREALRSAHRQLESPSLVARLTARLGSPVDAFLRGLPETWYAGFQTAVQAGLERTLELAIFSLDRAGSGPRGGTYHKALGALTGAASGLFGLPAVLAEMPVTSTLMLRAIADIARSEGEDLADPDTRLACMEVFALGGRTREDDAADIGYYGIRIALGAHLSRVPEQVLNQGIARWSPPGLVRFIADVAARFGVVVTEKTAVQMVPIVGAGAGGLINVLFMEHFEGMARAHFTIRRMERRYGAALVREEYARLSVSAGPR